MTDTQLEYNAANIAEERAAVMYEDQREEGRPKQHMFVGEKVVTGAWGGEQIWRKRTAGEVLANELANLEERKDEDNIPY